MEEYFSLDNLDDNIDISGTFTLKDIGEIDLNPLVDESSIFEERQHYKSKSKSKLIPMSMSNSEKDVIQVDVSKVSNTDPPKYVKSSLFSDCMDIQNKNNSHFSDNIFRIEKQLEHLKKINIDQKRRISVLETIVVDQDRELNIIKNKSKDTDSYLKDTFDKINKNNYILGQLIQGNTDMIQNKFFDTIQEHMEEPPEESNSKKSMKRKYNRDNYKKIREGLLEKQRREIAEREKTRKETAKLSEKISKELEDNDGDCVRASKRLKVKKIVQERVEGK